MRWIKYRYIVPSKFEVNNSIGWKYLPYLAEDTSTESVHAFIKKYEYHEMYHSMIYELEYDFIRIFEVPLDKIKDIIKKYSRKIRETQECVDKMEEYVRHKEDKNDS